VNGLQIAEMPLLPFTICTPRQAAALRMGLYREGRPQLTFLKLIRDVIHLRGQVIAVALVVACGIAAFVAMRSVYYSLLVSQDTYYFRSRNPERVARW
jgi:hypothetical protein